MVVEKEGQQAQRDERLILNVLTFDYFKDKGRFDHYAVVDENTMLLSQSNFILTDLVTVQSARIELWKCL